jgi:hypothetical protein
VHRPGQATTFATTGMESKPAGKPSSGKAKGGKANGKYYASYAERLADTRQSYGPLCKQVPSMRGKHSGSRIGSRWG